MDHATWQTSSSARVVRYRIDSSCRSHGVYCRQQARVSSGIILQRLTRRITVDERELAVRRRMDLSDLIEIGRSCSVAMSRIFTNTKRQRWEQQPAIVATATVTVNRRVTARYRWCELRTVSSFGRFYPAIITWSERDAVLTPIQRHRGSLSLYIAFQRPW